MPCHAAAKEAAVTAIQCVIAGLSTRPSEFQTITHNQMNRKKSIAPPSFEPLHSMVNYCRTKISLITDLQDASHPSIDRDLITLVPNVCDTISVPCPKAENNNLLINRVRNVPLHFLDFNWLRPELRSPQIYLYSDRSRRLIDRYQFPFGWMAWNCRFQSFH